MWITMSTWVSMATRMYMLGPAQNMFKGFVCIVVAVQFSLVSNSGV